MAGGQPGSGFLVAVDLVEGKPMLIVIDAFKNQSASGADPFVTLNLDAPLEAFGTCFRKDFDKFKVVFMYNSG